MHGMINRGLQCYIRDIHGVDVWEEICERAELSFYSFETMLVYDDQTTEDLLRNCGDLIQRNRTEILEDFGTYVVSDAALASVRRLLKFGGTSFVDFLMSLNFVHDRAKMAVPELDVPFMDVHCPAQNKYIVSARFAKRGYGAALLGLIRALADDYGALITIEHRHHAHKRVDEDVFEIDIIQENWADIAKPELVKH